MSDCFVYVIGNPDPHTGHPVKVGISHSPGARLASFQTACPFLIQIDFLWRMPDRATALEVERRFHLKCAAYRTYGEWVSVYCIAAAIEIDEIICEMWADHGLPPNEVEARAFAAGVSEQALASFWIEREARLSWQ